MRCDECKGHIVDYVVKKKGLHYYRCLKCNGVSMNAYTAPHSKKKGAHDLFVNFLDRFKLYREVVSLVTLQLTKMFDHFNDGQVQNNIKLKSGLAELEKKLKNLKNRQGLDEIDTETYGLTFEHISGKMQLIGKELNYVIPKLSNLEKLITNSLDKLSKIDLVWASSNFENKKRIQTRCFLKGGYTMRKITII